jgi:ZIP family zinc transporter
MTALLADAGLAASVTAIALLSAVVSVWYAAAPRAGPTFVPFGAGLLMGIVAFGILPELVESAGWAGGCGLLLVGFLSLWMVNRYVHPVCPSCSAGHDHGSCAVALHGFAMPLVVAGALHSFMDGLAIGASREGGEGGLAWGVFIAVAVHKIPEGLAYGAILRAALPSRASALGWCAVAQAPTIAGAVLESLAAPYLGAQWLAVPLALAGGSFLFLGYHAIHSVWRRRGLVPAFGPALTGAAGAAFLQQGLRVLLR